MDMKNLTSMFLKKYLGDRQAHRGNKSDNQKPSETHKTNKIYDTEIKEK